MAEKAGQDASRLNQYKYAAMSNLVLQADRRFVSRRGDEETGDPESLAGRVSVNDMGKRNAREAAPVQPAAQAQEQKKRKRSDHTKSQRAAGVLAEIEGLRYTPKTPATRSIYDLISTHVGQKMGGDYSLQITASATDSILEFLKDGNLKDFDKKREIDDILGVAMTSKEFNELVNLGKKITDYDAQDDDADQQDADAMDMDDENNGVAVDFGDDDDQDEQNFDVRDASDSSDNGDDGQDDAQSTADQDAINHDMNQDDTAVDEIRLQVQDPADSKPRQQHGVSAYDIDAYWLQRQIGTVYQDPHVQQEKTKQALASMTDNPEDAEDKGLRDIENDLMELFDYEHHELVALLVTNRDKIVWVTRWRNAAEDQQEQLALEKQMIQAGHASILKELRTRQPQSESLTVNMDVDARPPAQQSQPDQDTLIRGLQPRSLINLDNLTFEQGNHLMSNSNVKLPKGSVKRTFKGYEEFHVPAPKKNKDNDTGLVPVTDLPEWARPGFGDNKSLNRIQSTCYKSAFQDDGNMLICAPTGSGKTNVAMLTMLREIGKHRNPRTGAIDLDAFKIIYIAPLKALVQEQVGNFGKRLEKYGISVKELTGDRQLTKQQIAETQVIVTTPEKWDVITRKATDTSYTNLVRLICIDEIHLLHDDRGPVIESIVSRTLRRIEQTGDPVRLVGLSATLPNFRDVAKFLRVDIEKDLHYFDASFRPCPLKQKFIGITEKKAIKQLKAMNDICYTKVMEQVGQKGEQLLIFVHSRKETVKTAKYIRDKALELETVGQIMKSEASGREVLREEAEDVTSADLKDLLPYGFGVHHAGMSRSDRTTVEDLFSSGHVKVLVCTATLAWGVNLPAHAVIIKGTQVYSPEKGSWVELSPQDTLQMLGRAGRPQYDTYGEGIIITNQSEMQYYMSLLNQQLPIESQLMSKLADNLNAEIVLGNIRSRDDGVDWLGYTYLFVRMIRSPGLYQVGDEDDDESLEHKRVDLIHAAATVLERAQLVKYDKRSGKLQSTELGRIASHYYITHKSMLTYNQNITSSITPIELFRVFALSEEFKYIPVRQDEKLELAKLLGRVPLPVKETVDEATCKINVLLQAYISRLKLDGLALMADLVYVTQSAGRILRAMFEIALKKGWASVAKDALDLCKTAEKRMWPTMTPLRQFPDCPADVIKKAERIDVPWTSYYDLDPPRMGELLGMPRSGRQVCAFVEKFPRLDVAQRVLPMTRSTLRVELEITPRFVWDDELHGKAEHFWIMVEDCDGEEILFHDTFMLRKEYATAEDNAHLVDFTVALTEPLPPNYFITIVSDRWMHAESIISMPFQHLIMPEKFPAHTPLLDLQPLPVSALKRQEYIDLYPWKTFNKIQTQTFNALFTTDDSVFVGAPTGSGKTVCAEFALLRHMTQGQGYAVYIAPFQEQVDARLKDWTARLGPLDQSKSIVKLTGESTADIKLLKALAVQGGIALATPQQWDQMSRQWQRREFVQKAMLLIADDLHLLGGQHGHVYELVVSRAHAIKQQLEDNMRIIGISVSLSNGRDVGEWFGATKHTIFNFSPHVRPLPLELHIQSFSIPHFPSLMLAMNKPVYQALLNAGQSQSIVVVPSRKQARLAAEQLLSACLADEQEDRFLNIDAATLTPVIERVKERSLAEALSHGVGYFHEALAASDKRIVDHLYKQGAIQILLVSRDCAYEVDCTAQLTIIMGTQVFEGREHRYVDYTIAEMLQMLGSANRPGLDNKARAILMCPDVKRPYYKKFLSEALPIESELHAFLPDAFVTEISSKTIEGAQDAITWFTYTYFYRRVMANPTFYGLTDTTQVGFSSYLSEMIESTLKDLADANIIEMDEEEDVVTPLNAAMIAGYHNISFVTIQTLLLSLRKTTKLKALLEIVSAATEFEDIQIRRHEEHDLQRIYDRVPVKTDSANFESPHFKAFVLLQAHFSRMQLPADLAKDQELILKRVLSILFASVDVLSSEAHLNALSAMEMAQMVVQGMWDRDSSLKQIPHFDNDVVNACKAAGIEDVFSFVDAMDPSDEKAHAKLVASLGLDGRRLADAAAFCNDRYPNVELDFEVVDPEDITVGEPAVVNVTITRDVEDEQGEPDLAVHAPFYPTAKTQGWWIVVGEKSSKSLLAIKRAVVGRQHKVQMAFTVEEAGKHELTLYLMSDSYVGVDQAPTFEVVAAEAADGEDEGQE